MGGGGGFGIKMSWVEKNRKFNNREGGTIIWDSRVRMKREKIRITRQSITRKLESCRNG